MLDTNLNVAPYYDDFDETKNFHRILFKPTTPVQARELNQLQTILQNQIERFANGIYKDGAVITGCGVTFYAPLPYIRIDDHDANDDLVDVTQDFIGKYVKSANSGLQAKILTTYPGNETNYPFTNRLYVKFTNSGTYANGAQAQSFGNGETLYVYDGTVTANVVNFTVTSFSSDTSPNYPAAGKAHGVQVSDGLIYQKGFFVRVEEQTTVVSDTPATGNSVVGFVTNEFIIDTDQDGSLFDNSLGYENENAPGADRIKLVANLHVITVDDLSSTANFTSLIQYINGVPVINNPDQKYAALGDEMARARDETNGSFVIKPFNVNTQSANANYITAQVSPGQGYAEGYRVELLKTAAVGIRRGNDKQYVDDQLITTNYGNYVICDDVAGAFDFTGLQTVDIYDTPQNALTNRTFGNTGITGNKIGTANLRSILFNSNEEGTPSARYEFYVFNIVMNGGQSFALSAKSFVQTNNSAFADILLVNGQATVNNAERRCLVYNFGASAVSSLKDKSGNINTQYIFRQRSSTSMGVDGKISLTLATAHAGGTNKFPYGHVTLGDRLENDFTVVALSAGQTQSMGNVAVSGATVTGTNFTPRFSIGEYLAIGTGDVRRITAVTSTTLTVDAAFGAANTATTIVKYIPKGYIFPLDDTGLVGTRTVTVNTDTNLTIDTGLSAAGVPLAGIVPMAVFHNVLRYNTTPAKKIMAPGAVVKIDTNTHPNGTTGPWAIGLPDVHDITAIYTGTSYSRVTGDVQAQFYFDSGQRDTHYDLAMLTLRPGQSLPANTKMTIVCDVFVPNTTPGVGFFTIDSYPIDDVNTTNANAITTAEVPVYVSESGNFYALRDCVDFRPYKASTAVLTGDDTQATINPPMATPSFILDTVGTYMPTPDQTFSTDLSFYLGRKDMIYFSAQGYIKSLEGSATENPLTPDAPSDAMPICILNVPAYPSLSSEEASSLSDKNRKVYSAIRDTRYTTKVSIVTNKRYRMKDIATLDNRISRLEYYTALNLLESATTSLQVPDANGLDRFKNGIFVDPFTNFSLSSVANPEFKIAIDQDSGVARPFFSQRTAQLHYSTSVSNGVVKTGRLITLPYNAVKYVGQPYATNTRNCAAVQFNWAGQMKLYPEYTNNIDKVASPAVQVSLDMSTPWTEFANSPFGMSYGDWRTTDTQVATQTDVTGQQAINGALFTTTQTTQATTTTQARDGQKLNVSLSNSSYALGNYVQDVTVQPYIAATEIGFYAWGLRPSTQVHLFFDGVNLDTGAATGIRNTSVNDTTDSNYVTRTSAYGSGLKTDATGVLYGKILIPPTKFRTGERAVRIADVLDVNTNQNSVTTSATATLTASNISVNTGSTTLSTVSAQLGVTGLKDSYSSTTVQTSTNLTVANDPNYVPPVTQIINNDYVTNNEYVTNNVANNTYVTNNTTNVTQVTQVTPAAPVEAPTPAPVPVVPPAPVVVPIPVVPPAPVVPIPTMLEYIGNAQGFDRINKAFEYENLYDPLAQAFTVSLSNGVAGMYLTDITAYFYSKSKNASTGITLYVTEILNGYPDTTRILPFSRTHLTWDQVNTSTDGQTGTKFTFESPVYVTNGSRYTFVLFPDGGDPDYISWTAILGNSDVSSGFQVSSKPYVDTAFYSSNQLAWSALQNEFVKFDIGRANFYATAGVAGFQADDVDYFKISNIVNTSSTSSLRIGDKVFGVVNGTVDTSVQGYVSFYNPVTQEVNIINTTGKFTTNQLVQYHRLPYETSGISSATLIASSTLSSIFDPIMNAVVPQYAKMQPAGTTLQVGVTGVNQSYNSDGSPSACVFENETEFYDYARIVPSRSNEVQFAGSRKLVSSQIVMSTDTSYVSPAIDVVRSSLLFIENKIDPTTFDLTREYYNDGAVQTKYISKIVTLADGQDSEDLKVYLTGYKPLSTAIHVYAKFIASEDPASITDKTWTKLAIDDDTVFSDYRNITDYREQIFSVPSTIASNAPSTTAYIDSSNGLTYTSSAKFTTYKAFQLKIVLLSDTTARVPRLNDVRALCMLL